MEENMFENSNQEENKKEEVEESSLENLQIANSEFAAIETRNISRRSFLAGSAALAATLMLATGCTSSSEDEEAEGSSIDDSTEAESEVETEEDENEDDYSEDFPVTVTDLSGYEITIEEAPKSIGALLGGTYGHISFLGAADRVSCRKEIENVAWNELIDPNFDSYDIVDFETASCRDPNVEELAELGVDVVYYWSGLDEQKQNMEDIGIKVVEASLTGLTFDTVDEFCQLYKDQMYLFADTLGGTAKDKAEEWCTYFDDEVAMVVERTQDLSDDERPTVYCLRDQEDGLECFAKSSYFSMLVEAAGGTLVSKDVDTDSSGFTTVTIEQVAEWNPEVIFMGWFDDPTIITENEQWASFDAVVNDQVYTLPYSLNSTDWSYSEEFPLELMYVANILHPDLFSDIDIIAEIQDFYKTFYDCDLTENQAQAMIDRQDPPED